MQRPVHNSTFQSNIPLAADISFGVIYSIFGMCSLCGNSMLLYVSYQRKHQLKPAEFFIINLAVSDLGMTISLYPLAVTSSFQHRWLYGKTVCIVYAFCGVLFGICSLTTLTILSTVCCLKVCYPIYGNRIGFEHGRVLIACAWGYALLFACSPLAHWGQYGPEPYGTACCIDWVWSNKDPVARSYTITLFICCYLLPCTIIVLSYTHILLTVRGSRRAVKQHISGRVTNVQTIIVKLSVAVCIGFIAAWSPYAFVSIWAAFGDPEKIPPLAFALSAMLSKSSTIYNPLIYLLLKPNFRQLLCKDMHSLWQVCRHSGCEPRSAPVMGLHSLRPQSQCMARWTDWSKRVGRWCNDPFEQFKLYPRSCPVTISTVQFSLHEITEPELDPEIESKVKLEKDQGLSLTTASQLKRTVIILFLGKFQISELQSVHLSNLIKPDFA
ncbi:opsin 7, group member a [Trichomycterus rosablanca]|uniref:opsin 7, group member a n=1 Tax=Trichomycterus rosablanca TaxID=2290929 RepID=UPI002F360F06